MIEPGVCVCVCVCVCVKEHEMAEPRGMAEPGGDRARMTAPRGEQQSCISVLRAVSKVWEVAGRQPSPPRPQEQ